MQASLPIKDIARHCHLAKDIGIIHGKQGGLSELLKHLNELVEGGAIDEQTLNLYARKTLPHVRILVRRILSQNLADIPVHINRLIGLGPGLTPSCDDMLMGFMISLLLVTEALNGDVSYVKRINQVIASLAIGRTTLISQKLLEHAALGEASEMIHNLVEAILTGNGEQVREATLKLLAVGHSSGTDTLLGILLGFHVAVTIA